MTYITKAADIPNADTKVLVATYNWLLGKSIKKFSSRAAGEAQVANALMIAADRAAHKGVAKGTKPNVADGALGEGNEGKAPAAAPKVDPLAAMTKTLAGNHVKLKAEKPARKSARTPVSTVQYVKGGRSKPQEGSIRNAVLQYIIKGDEHRRTIDSLEKHFAHPCRGYVQKLLEKGHLKIVD